MSILLLVLLLGVENLTQRFLSKSDSLRNRIFKEKILHFLGALSVCSEMWSLSRETKTLTSCFGVPFYSKLLFKSNRISSFLEANLSDKGQMMSLYSSSNVIGMGIVKLIFKLM